MLITCTYAMRIKWIASLTVYISNKRIMNYGIHEINLESITARYATASLKT